MIRKKLSLNVFLVLALLFSLPWICYASQSSQQAIDFKVNGNVVQTINPILIEKGTALVSLTDFCDSLGANFSYSPSTGNIHLSYKDKNFALKTGQDTVMRNKESLQIAGEPVAKEGVVYLPLRDLCQLLGQKINWEPSNKEIEIAIAVSQSAFAFNPQVTGGDAQVAIRELIPVKAKLISPLLEADLDGDGIKETVAGYKTQQNRVGIIVVKKEEGTYSKIWQKEGQHFFDLTDLSLKDFNKDGKAEIIVGWLEGVSAGSRLEIISWQDGQFKPVYTNSYHRLEVDDFNGDGKPEIALWKKDTGDYYQVDIYSWNGSGLVLANQSCPGYFLKVVKYYQSLLRTNGENRILYYYLADAYQKAGQGAESIKAIKKGSKIAGNYPTRANFLWLEAKAYHQTKEYRKAIKIYPQALAAPGLTIISVPEAHWGLAQSYLALGKKQQALEEIKAAVGLSNQWEGYQKAKQILLN